MVIKKSNKNIGTCNCENENCNCGNGIMKNNKVIGILICLLGLVIIYNQVSGLRTKKVEQKMIVAELLGKDDNVCHNLKKIEKYAEDGNIDAQMKLFELYAGECANIPNSALKKGMWIMRSANKEEYAPAQFKLSLLYEFGEGMPRNYREALKWLKLSAEQGYPLAEYELAKRYRDGSEFLEADNEQYLYWLDQSARHGFEPGASELANLYENGVLVSQNYIEAYKWYSLATFVDYKKLNALELEMNADEIEEAQRKAIVLQKEIFKYVNENPNLF